MGPLLTYAQLVVHCNTKIPWQPITHTCVIFSEVQNLVFVSVIHQQFRVIKVFLWDTRDTIWDELILQDNLC